MVETDMQRKYAKNKDINTNFLRQKSKIGNYHKNEIEIEAQR